MKSDGPDTRETHQPHLRQTQTSLKILTKDTSVPRVADCCNLELQRHTGIVERHKQRWKFITIRNSFQSNSRGLVSFDNTSMFCLAFPNTAVGFTTAVYWCFARHCGWHRIFLLPTKRFSWCPLNSSSSGSTKKIPRNLLALSSSGFSIAHFCFALLVAASDMCFHISGHTLSGLEVVSSLVRLLQHHVYPSGGLSFNKVNLVNPVHASDNSLSPSMFQ